MSRGDLDRLMELLDKNGDGLISYENFVDFMVRKDDPTDRQDDYSGYDNPEEGGRGRRKKRGGRSDYTSVVGEYDERLSPRGGRGDGEKSRSRSPHGGKAGRREPSKSTGKSKEFICIRKKIIGTMDGRGSGAEKKMTKVFQDLDRDGRGLVSIREFHSATKKCGLASLSGTDLSVLSNAFDSEDDGRFNWEDFVGFIFHPERRKGERDRGRDDDELSEESVDHGRKKRPSPASRRAGRGGSGHWTRPQSRKQRSRYSDDDEYSEDLKSYRDDSRSERMNVKGTKATIGGRKKYGR